MGARTWSTRWWPTPAWIVARYGSGPAEVAIPAAAASSSAAASAVTPPTATLRGDIDTTSRRRARRRFFIIMIATTPTPTFTTPPTTRDRAPTWVPLSESQLWATQRAYFEAQGPRAWASGAVPSYVTNHTYLARAYAEVIAGFAVSGAGAPEALRPLYLVELGAGAGRLGHGIVRALRSFPELAAAGWRPVYVLTDVSRANLAWWRDHPALRPLFDAGLLDLAHFDVERDHQLVLERSGRVLSPQQPAGRLVVIANYVFDSVRHDAFVADDDGLAELLVDDRGVIGDADGFRAAELRYRAVEVEPARRYADPVWARVLDGYRDQVRGAFGFPSGALAGLDRLRALTVGPMLVISADKGGSRLDEVVVDGGPGAAVHGSVSFAVNYHAIGAWATAHGGTWMHPEHRHRAIEVCAFVVGGGALAGARTTDVATAARAVVTAFDRAIAQRGPDDFHALKRGLLLGAAGLTVPELLAYLRLSGHDPRLAYDLVPAITAQLTGADHALKLDVARMVARAWDGYFALGEEADIAGRLAGLAAAAGAPRLASALRQHARPGPGRLVAADDDPFRLLDEVRAGA